MIITRTVGLAVDAKAIPNEQMAIPEKDVSRNRRRPTRSIVWKDDQNYDQEYNKSNNQLTNEAVNVTNT